jgi:hypothetical protein
MTNNNKQINKLCKIQDLTDEFNIKSIDDFIDLVFVLTDSVFKTNDYSSQRLIELFGFCWQFK